MPQHHHSRSFCCTSLLFGGWSTVPCGLWGCIRGTLACLWCWCLSQWGSSAKSASFSFCCSPWRPPAGVSVACFCYCPKCPAKWRLIICSHHTTAIFSCLWPADVSHAQLVRVFASSRSEDPKGVSQLLQPSLIGVKGREKAPSQWERLFRFFFNFVFLPGEEMTSNPSGISIFWSKVL